MNCSTYKMTILFLFIFNLDPFTDPAHSLDPEKATWAQLRRWWREEAWLKMRSVHATISGGGCVVFLIMPVIIL